LIRSAIECAGEPGQAVEKIDSQRLGLRTPSRRRLFGENRAKDHPATLRGRRRFRNPRRPARRPSAIPQLDRGALDRRASTEPIHRSSFSSQPSQARRSNLALVRGPPWSAGEIISAGPRQSTLLASEAAYRLD
jgi:hypothetical protein